MTLNLNLKHPYNNSAINIAVIGLGYVGLPLALAFARHFPVRGYDNNERRITDLARGHDYTQETDAETLKKNARLSFVADITAIKACNVYIVTVPTPIDEQHQPDLTLIRKATEMLAEQVDEGDIVIYESTVYPGVTEDICAPIIADISGLQLNKDFFVAYSPERINPGDKEKKLEDIVKVTSGSTLQTADFVDALYATIIRAGTYKASSIKVAEASKVIENTQRDVNIALVNEFAMIFNKLDIDTREVIAAASTKWNFTPYYPGLVGGHCIGIDPYYLSYRAHQVGHEAEMILAGRHINQGMSRYVATQIKALMLGKDITVSGSRALVMGLTFKENCPDLRNSRVADVITHLQGMGIEVDVYDPWADVEQAQAEYGIDLQRTLKQDYYDVIVLAVAHRQFCKMTESEIKAPAKARAVFYDVKSARPIAETDGRL